MRSQSERRRLSPMMRRALLVGAVALVAVLPLLNIPGLGLLPGPTYAPGSLQVMAVCLLTAALALSYHVLFGVAGLLSFGHALYFAAGLYGLAIALKHWQLPLLPAALVVLVLVVLLSLAVGSLSLRVTGISFAMVTLAFAQAGSVLVSRNPGGLTGGEEGLGLDVTHVPDLLVGVRNTRNLFWLALLLLVVVAVLVTWFERSRAGHVAVATRENELRVRVLGMNPYRIRLLVFVLGGTLAGVVGMAWLLVQSGAQVRSTSADFTLSLLVMVVLGGVGSRWGAVIGGALYALLDQRLTALAGTEAIASLPAVLRVPLSEPMFILGAMFILVVLFAPGGLIGAATRLRSAAGLPPRSPRPGRGSRAEAEERLEQVDAQDLEMQAR